MAKLTSLEAINSNEVNLQDGLYLAHKINDNPDTYEDRRININKLAGALPTEDIKYDNSESGLTASDVQGAIDELAAGGREVLNDLTDVSISSPAANQLLQYNSTTEKWENKQYIEGANNTVTGTNAHAEGNTNTSSGNYSHTEGLYTKASGFAAHAEGMGTKGETGQTDKELIASGNGSHAEGKTTEASGFAAHAQGQGSIASGNQSHAEGYYSTASSYQAHAEGHSTTASGENTHAEGKQTVASGFASHAEGLLGRAIGDYSHIEGYHYSGAQDALGEAAHAEGYGTIAIGGHSHAEGAGCKAYGYESHAEGAGSVAEGSYSHVEGAGNTVNGDRSHIEGAGNKNSGFSECSHVEGAGNVIYSPKGHVEGCGNTGSGLAVHIEGAGNYLRGEKSHAEGGGNNYFGYGSHIEGKHNTGVGIINHIEGLANKIGVLNLPSQFNPDSTYAVDDIVTPNASYLQEGSESTPPIYKCITAPGTIQAQTGVEIITPTTWNESSSYVADSVVKYNNNYYKSNADVPAGTIPDNTSPGLKWTKITEILSPFYTITINAPYSARFFLLNCNANMPYPPSGETGQAGTTQVAKVTGSVTLNAMWEAIPVTTQSHVEGTSNTVLGDLCHIEGASNTANSNYAHVEGVGNIASGENQHVAGKYNVEDNQGVYAEIIGNGTYDSTVTPAVTTRSNARTLDWSGNEMIAGDLTFMGNKSLNTMLPDPPATDGTYTLQCTVLNGVATYAWV